MPNMNCCMYRVSVKLQVEDRYTGSPGTKGGYKSLRAGQNKLLSFSLLRHRAQFPFDRTREMNAGYCAGGCSDLGGGACTTAFGAGGAMAKIF